ncbi:hypothetical protein GF369_01805 [Candidatus Peregrinibacteria bacterium]|nr:hypothetical protein [Candidatus Peregrinibacteria bacterium]
MEQACATNIEWMERTIHSYVEEVRAAALFLLSHVTEEERGRRATMIIATIREHIDSIEDCLYGDDSECEQGTLSFPFINEEEIEPCYRLDITDACLDYKRRLKHVMRTLSPRERLERLPGLSSSVLRTIGELHHIE